MKALDKQNNMERAAILFDLFPQEIPALIEFIKGMADTIINDEAREREDWDNGILSFDLWLRLAGEVGQNIERHGKNLAGNRRLFTDQLFQGYLAAFTGHCIAVYLTTIQHPNERFVLCAKMLYGF